MKVKSIGKKVAVLALSAGLLASPFNTYSAPVKAEAWKVEDILSTLSAEQRLALKQLELNDQTGLQGFQPSELLTDEEVSVIVQFHSKPSKVAFLDAEVKGKKLMKENAQAQVEKEHKTFKEDVQKYISSVNGKKASPKITRSYKTAFNGVAMKLPASQVEDLTKSAAVKAVFKNQTYTVDPIQKNLPQDVEREITTSVESLPFLKVDKLHDEGITGEGIKVGVLDTGIDYNHPDLKDAYKGGYDFVDNDADPMEATYEDWKNSKQPEFQGGSSYYTSHGTHVSGTIAGQNANDSEVSVKGVAPDSDLYSYRVLGPYGSGTTETVLAGIDQAVQDGMDVINLSLGAPVNDPYFPTSTAINYAVLNGVTAVVSAGNNGPNDFTLGSPGTAALALTVGASDVPVSQTLFTGKTADGWTSEIVSMARGFADQFESLEGTSLELADVGLGGAQDYKNKNVQGKIAFVQRGGATLNDKVKLAKLNGAKAVIMYNNADGHVGFNLGESTDFVPAFSMTKADGEKLKAAITAGNTAYTFTNLKETFTKGDMLADFSSRGPVTKNYEMKPEIVAPGVSVLSTYPAYKENPEEYKYAYARLSGTSMASPFTAGAAALLLGENPDLEPAEIKTILMNSADPLSENYSVFEVGAGRIDPYQALHGQTKIQVNDETLLPEGEDLVTIKNQTGGLSFDNQVVMEGESVRVKKSLDITLGSEKKKTFDVQMTENVQAKTNSLKENGVTVHVDKEISVTKKKKVNITLSMPKTAKEGIYEGYLLLSNKKDKNESYRVPFSVKKSEEGFNNLDLLTPSITTPIFNHAYDGYRISTAMVQFSTSSPIDSMDVILQDAKTGTDLGLIGTLDMTAALDDTSYFLNAFNGTYYAFTGDKKQPVSEESSIAQPGHYKMKFVYTLPSGKSKTIDHDLFIDIDAPSVKSSLDGDSPFIEYQPGQATYPFELEITDKNVQNMQNAGLDMDQSSNFMVYTYGFPFPHGPVYMDSKGKLVDEVAMDENAKSLSFNVIGYDKAGNQAKWKEYFFVKEGTPNTYAKHKTEVARSGDILTASLVLDNLEGVKEAVWTFGKKNTIKHVDLLEANLTDELSGKATLNVSGDQVKVTFNEEMKFDQKSIVDVKVKVQDEIFYPIGYIDPTAKIIDADNKTAELLHGGSRFNLKPSFNRVQGYLSPEGYYVDNGSGGFTGNRDWSKVGASVKLTNSSGDVFDASYLFDGNARFTMEKLPLSKDPYTFEVKVPGHFMTVSKELIGFEYKGVLYGKSASVHSELTAGDVNQDNVIDVLDAIAIQEAWNTNNRAADIDFNGTVDSKDISYVKKNYFIQNKDVENAPAPTKTKDGKTLESILKELGVN
ncbi:hypothetical protein HMPREF3291_12045 [Bacillus sp. HMSC76G11]|nr:hypothetical protein HMPREF3291_12045 [Bacillus sp. HMSC76G11]